MQLCYYEWRSRRAKKDAFKAFIRHQTLAHLPCHSPVELVKEELLRAPSSEPSDPNGRRGIAFAVPDLALSTNTINPNKCLFLKGHKWLKTRQIELFEIKLSMDFPRHGI